MEWSIYRGLFLATVAVQVVGGSRILIMSYPGGSRFRLLTTIGEGLMDRGHQVYATSSATFQDLTKLQKGRIPILTYLATGPGPDEAMLGGGEMPLEMMAEHPIQADLRQLAQDQASSQMCTEPLQDEQFFHTLKSLHFDLALLDGFPNVERCMYVLAYRLGLPYVSTKLIHEPWLYGSPALPSAWPTMLTHPPLTHSMTFGERLTNTWTMLSWAYDPAIPLYDDEFLRPYFYETSAVPLMTLMGRSWLWLVDHLHVLDYPRPQMPNEVNIGGLSTAPAKPLPHHLNEFIDANQNGFILCTFGSTQMSLPAKITDVLMSSFKQVKFNVLMKFYGDFPPDVPPNVKLHPWLPQNDILGHHNIKLFISHCGAGGANEALYHGVPVICLPMFGDQPYNARRMVYHGFGKYLKLLSLTSSQLVAAINTVATNETYKMNMMKASAIMRDEPMRPLDRAVYWVEHVLKYGGSHLRPHALDMPWYEYLMLDILILLLLIVIAAATILIYCIKLILGVLKSENKEKAD